MFYGLNRRNGEFIITMDSTVTESGRHEWALPDALTAAIFLSSLEDKGIVSSEVRDALMARLEVLEDLDIGDDSSPMDNFAEELNREVEDFDDRPEAG
jgi:hypothetical protein